MKQPTQKKIKLFAAYHKPFIIPKATYVQPIQAGKALSTIDLSMPGDNTNNHISQRNNSFCELTVLYWIWENADRSQFDFWGLMHYRRYFIQGDFLSNFFKKKIYKYKVDQTVMNKIINDKLYKSLLDSLQTHDVILMKPIKGGEHSIEDNYKEKHIPEHWDIMIEVLLTKYPDYKRSLHYFKQSSMSYFNMMIANWNVWDEYLQWLFDILFEVEKRIGKIDDVYQARVYGFLSERMINLFVYHNSLKIAYRPIASFEK